MLFVLDHLKQLQGERSNRSEETDPTYAGTDEAGKAGGAKKARFGRQPQVVVEPLAALATWKSNDKYPIGSMVLVYILTWLGYIDDKCYHMYHTWILWVWLTQQWAILNSVYGVCHCWFWTCLLMSGHLSSSSRIWVWFFGNIKTVFLSFQELVPDFNQIIFGDCN